MRHLAIKITEENIPFIERMIGVPLADEWQGNWCLVSERLDTSSVYTNDYGFFHRFPNANRDLTIQVVRD